MKKFANMVWRWFLHNLRRGNRPYRIITDYQSSRTDDQSEDSLQGHTVSHFRGLALAASSMQQMLFSGSRTKTKHVVQLDPVELIQLNLNDLNQPCQHGDPVVVWLVENCQYPMVVLIHYCRVDVGSHYGMRYCVDVEFTSRRDAMLFKLRFS